MIHLWFFNFFLNIGQGLKKLQTEIATFEKQKTEELERLEQFKEEELKKLRYGLRQSEQVHRYVWTKVGCLGCGQVFHWRPASQPGP